MALSITHSSIIGRAWVKLNRNRNRNRNRTRTRTTINIITAISCILIGFLSGISFQSWSTAFDHSTISNLFKYEVDEYAAAANNISVSVSVPQVEVVPQVEQVQVKEWTYNLHYPVLQPNNTYNPYWLVVSHSRKLAITIIPKVMCTTIRDAFSKNLEHCGQSISSISSLPDVDVDVDVDVDDNEPHPAGTGTGAGIDDTSTKDNNSIAIPVAVDAVDAVDAVVGYNNNTFSEKISKKIPLKRKEKLIKQKQLMMQHYKNNENNVVKRCAEARRNPELRYNHSMYLEDENYTTVLLVRDPFERAYSAYRNSDTNPFIRLDNDNDNDNDDDDSNDDNDDDDSNDESNGNSGNSGNSNSNGVCQNTTQCTFEMWVNRLIDFRSITNSKLIRNNEHFITQTEIAQFNSIRYHYILRMTSKAELTFLFKNLMGIKNGVPTEHANSSSKRRRRRRQRQRSRQLLLKQNNNNNNNSNNNVTNNNKNNNNKNNKNNKNNNKVLTLFESIPLKTMDQLAILYKDDLKLWQELLDHGTPRSSEDEGEGEEEITLYDYYITSRSTIKK